jgi:hypothetical protein
MHILSIAVLLLLLLSSSAASDASSLACASGTLAFLQVVLKTLYTRRGFFGLTV